MTSMAGPWSLDKLAAAAGETERRIHLYIDMGCCTGKTMETLRRIPCIGCE
jgi:hypothetical protein